MAHALNAREVSSVELVQDAFMKLDEIEPSIQAFISLVDRGSVLGAAQEIDKQRARGNTVSKFAGVPIAIKDNIAVAGHRMTAGSKILANYYPPTDSTAASRIKAAGMLILGKTNMDEFGFGSSTENSAFHPTYNPRALDRVPGGSSGGSAAAVAAGVVPWALGTDTGGSVRQPAACCGIVGFRPTYGRVSRNGLVAFCSSMDQIGPLANSVEDAEQLLLIISGPDNCDSTTLPAAALDRSLALLTPRVGIPREYLTSACQPEIVEAIEHVASVAGSLGWPVEDVSLPLTEYALAIYYIISSVEAHSNLARYDGVKFGLRVDGVTHEEMVIRTRTEGFGAEAKRRILLGTFAASAGYQDKFYNRACQARSALQREFERAFEAVDLILSPISPTTAWRLGERVVDPLFMYMSDVYSVPGAVAGVPSVVIPAGVDTEGLPIGVQLTGSFGNDVSLLGAARELERALLTSGT